MSSRQLPPAAAKKILPALVFLAASGLSPLAAQTQDGAAAQEAPGTPPTFSSIEEILSSVAASAAVQTLMEKAPSSGAVFDAPNMPGVRMMAPIPDALAPSAARPAGDITPRTTTLAPIPASVAPPPPASAAAPAAGKQATVRQTDRARLVQAFTAAKRSDWSQALRLADQTHSRPTGFIFEWLRLVDAGSNVDFDA